MKNILDISISAFPVAISLGTEEMEKKIRKLGEGFQGEVWLIKVGNEQQILKTSHITEEDSAVGAAGKSPVWREIEFGDFLKSVKHPDSFMTLRSYSIEMNCNYKREVPKRLTGEDRKEFIKMNNSTHCVYFKYVPVLDGTLLSLYELINKKYLPKLNRETWPFSSKIPAQFYQIKYQLLFQQLYTLYFLYEHGWIHRDAHLQNWMYKKSAGTVALSGLKIGKTEAKFRLKCDYQLYLCDYGLIIHKSHPRGRTEGTKYKYEEVKNKDIYLNIIDAVYFPRNPAIDKKFIDPKYDCFKVERDLRKTPESKLIPELVLTAAAPDIRSWIYAVRFRMRYPELYLEILGVKLTPAIKKEILHYSETEINQLDFLLANAMKPAKVFVFLSKLI